MLQKAEGGARNRVVAGSRAVCWQGASVGSMPAQPQVGLGVYLEQCPVKHNSKIKKGGFQNMGIE